MLLLWQWRLAAYISTAPSARVLTTADSCGGGALLQRLGVSRVDSLVIHDLDLGYGSRAQVERYLSELEGQSRTTAACTAVRLYVLLRTGGNW